MERNTEVQKVKEYLWIEDGILSETYADAGAVKAG